MFYKNRFGFTLAEVLITLGIIGVVAAMTIPVMISSYNKHITETRLKKFYSLFNQAIKLSVAENGEVEGWDSYWDASKNIYDEDGNVKENSDVVDAAFEKYLAPYMKVMTKKRVKESRNRTLTLYVLADGSAFTYRSYDTRDITFFPKNPEKCMQKNPYVGVCAFLFIFYPINNADTWKYHYQQGFEPYMYDWDGKKESLKDNKTYGCNSDGNGYMCGTIIKLNGWKIPADYPRKIQY